MKSLWRFIREIRDIIVEHPKETAIALGLLREFLKSLREKESGDVRE